MMIGGCADCADVRGNNTNRQYLTNVHMCVEIKMRGMRAEYNSNLHLICYKYTHINIINK